MTESNLLQLFTPPAEPGLLNYGHYDPALVILSVLVAIFSSWMGLQMAGNGKSEANGALRGITLLTGSLALGCGVWAMHFIGMLAFDLCISVDYDPAITVLSILPSVAASFVALSILGQRRVGLAALLGGGALTGGGIGAMHYTGMAAMKMGVALQYDPAMFALSLVVAVALATLALWVRFGLLGLSGHLSRDLRLLLSAVVMGCAIAGMHYTGMAAARFVGQIAPGSTAGAGNTFLALAISLITVAFTIFVASANGLLRYRELYRQLSRSERWMRALLTTTVDGVITVNGQGTIHEFNASAERIFGWSRAEIVGRNVSLLIADPDRSQRDGLLNYLRTGNNPLIGQGNDIVGVRKDGSQVPVRRALGHAHLGDDELFVLFITDISDRLAIEAALRDNEQQFRSLIGNLPGIAFRCAAAPGHPAVFLSDGIERGTGYPIAEFLGQPPQRALNQLILPEDRARVAAAINESMRSAQPYLVEYRLQHADGSQRWMWEHGAVVRDADGEPHWIDGVILDISERHQMEQDLRLAKETAEQAAAARASFVANMSHEIRTPMNAILGFTDVLLDGELGLEQRRHLDTVRNAGRSLLRLLNEILDTAKLDKGAVELEAHDYSLLALLDELSSTFGGSARNKGLTVDVGYDPALPERLHGDELRLRQILGNLLDNAIKFTASGGVTLKAALQDGQLHVRVSDSGIGIPPDRLDAIFDPFIQADASMTRRFGGTGLGTTISRQLVALMGGRIWAESPPGGGATFHVLLPLRPARRAPQSDAGRSAFVLPPLRVLAADDVPQNLELLGLLLNKRGHSMRSAGDGSQAVAMAAGEDFDVILMDVQMPLLDGLSATREIRAAALREGRARVPVVAMTASVLAAHRKASAAAGMDGFASKPVDWYALSHEIARVLGLAEAGAAPDGAGTPAATAAAMPAQAGRRVLDYPAGLQRWVDNSAAYRQALARFDTEHHAAAHTLAALLAAGQDAAARDQAHRIGGVAANLGLEQLALTLGQLEQACAADRSSAAAALERQAALERLAAQLPAALLAIRAQAGPAPAPKPAAGAAALPADASAARTAAAILLQSMQRGELDDAALAALAAGLGSESSLAALRAALADFDFALAQRTLLAMLSTLDPESP